MRLLALLMMLSLISSPALAQSGGRVYRAPRPRPPATAGSLERDPGTGNYHLSYTDEEGNAYTITVEASDRVVFDLGINISVDSAYERVTYSYSLKNTATSGSTPGIYSMILVPCDDPGATASSSQWTTDVGVVKLISARTCEFSGPMGSRLAPSAVLSDARVVSRWLPGIGRAIVSCEANSPLWPSGEATPHAAYELAETVNSDYLGGKKVEMLVPLKDPASFATPDRGLGLVLADLSKACTLGWVKTPGICNSLEVKLKQAQSAILQNDLKLAGNHLKSLQNELAAQRGKHVNDLAFMLLNTNVGYIQFHL